MSPKKQPAPLNAICMKLLSNQLIYALSDEEGKHLDEVEIYMSSATYVALQDLLNGILGHIDLDASTRFNCLQVLLKEGVKTLETGIFPRFYYDKILVIIRDQGKGLHHLNLKGVWVRDYPWFLNSSIRSLKNLKSLIIPHMCDDSVITSVLSLKHLVKLDISGEASYTSVGIKDLKSETIRILDIGSFGKTNLCQDSISGHQLVAEIIENLPNLNVLKTYSFTGHALLHLYKKDNNFRTKLTYIHATDCTVEILDAVVKTCPHLENTHINCPQEGVVSGLNAIKNLHSLKLTKGDGVEFRKFLQSSGEQLEALKLNHSRQFPLDLSELCEYSPYIATLECYQMNVKFTNPDAFYMTLQKVEILYCDMNDTVIKTLLINAPFLRSMIVGSSIEMTDGDMFRLLGECSLQNLEELLLADARFLTAITVELLADNCPKLKTLGTLTGWDIEPDEIQALRILIALANIDLHLYSEEQ